MCIRDSLAVVWVPVSILPVEGWVFALPIALSVAVGAAVGVALTKTL